MVRLDHIFAVLDQALRYAEAVKRSACSKELSRTIAAYMRDNYYNNYAMILYESDVQVMREEKFP